MSCIKELEQRLSTLERRANRYRNVATGLGLVIVAGVGIAAAAPPRDRGPDRELIQTQRLEIVDAEGNLVFRAAAAENGGQVDLWNGEGQNTVRMTSNDQGGDFAMWNIDGLNVYGAFATADGGEAAVWNRDGARVLRVRAGEQGGRIDMHNRRDQSVCTVSASDNGGRLQVSNPDGQAVLTADATESGGSMTINNAAGAPVLSAAADARGTGRLDIADADGDPRVSTAVSEAGGVTRMQNADGATVAMLGATGDQPSGGLELSGTDGTKMVVLETEAGGGRCDIRAGNGRSVFTAGVVDDGIGLSLHDKNGRKSVVMSAQDRGALLNLYNGYGSPMVGIAPGPNGRSGVVSVMNERGLRIAAVEANDDEAGQIRLFEADGRKERAILPFRKSLLDHYGSP